MAREQFLVYRQPAPIRGLDTSKPEDQLSPLFYPDGLNVDTDNNAIEKAGGYTQLLAGFPTAKKVMEGVEYGDSSGNIHLAFATETTFVEYNSGGTWSDRSGGVNLTGDADYPVFMVNVAGLSTDLLIVTNGKDPIKKWTGSGNWASLSLTGYTTLLAGCAIGAWGHLLLGDTTEDGTHKPYRLVFSNNGDSEDYSGVTAGFLNLIEDSENSRIQTLLPLNQSIIAYKESAIYNVTYKGGRNGVYFAANPVLLNSGALSRKSVARLGNIDLHVVVTKDNIHLFDGFGFIKTFGSGNEYLGDRVKDFFFDDLNWSKRGQVFCQSIPQKQKVIIIYPAGASTVPNKALIWDWKVDAWHPWQFADTGHSIIVSDQFFTTPKYLYGIDSDVMTLYSGYSHNGTAINGYFRTALNDFSSMDQRYGIQEKTTEFVELENSGTDPTVEVRGSNNIEIAPSFSSADTPTDDSGTFPITRAGSESVRETARYISLKCSDDSSDAAFRIAKYNIFFRLRGRT